MKEILIIENDMALNRKLTNILGVEGYKVTSAYTVKEVQHYFRTDAIHLVI